MSAARIATSTPIPNSLAERLELANRLFHEFRASCFWHCAPDLIVTEELIPLVVTGLRKHGGRRGFILGAKLLENGSLDKPCQ